MATVVRSTPETFSQSHLLRNFAPNNRHLFPVQVKVLEYDDAVPVLDSHQVEIGSVLVLHGWTRQPKVLATAALRRYAVPLSYQGTFRVIARSLKTQPGLEYSFQSGRKLRVVEANPDPDEGLLPVREGDVIVALGESVEDGGGGGGGGASYIDCRKTDEHSGRTSGVFISSSWDITFEEILDDLPERGEGGPGLFSIRDFASIVSDRSIDVELVHRGSDHPDPAVDLPTNTPINLCKHVVEPAVYASLSTPITPAFHISMRAPLYVRFVRQLPKTCSPLLTKQNAHISTLDRCVELLTPEIFHEIIVNHRRVMQLIQKPASNGGLMTLPTAGGSRGRRGLSSSQSQVDLREMTSSSRKGPLSTTGSLSSRFKWRFSLKRKGNRSTGGSSRAGSDFGSIRSLPVTSRRKSDRFQFLLSSGDRLDTSHGAAYRRKFTLPPANPRAPLTTYAANQNRELDDELIGRPIPSVTARLSQRKSTNKKQPSKATIYEEVNGEEEIDEDASGRKLSNSNNSTEPRNSRSSERQANTEQTEQSEYERLSTNRTSSGDDIQTNKTLAAEAHSTNRIRGTAQGNNNAANHTTEQRSLTANQKQSSDYDAPRPRTNRQPLNVSGGNDVTAAAKVIGRHGYSHGSSDARTSSDVSDSVSSTDANPHQFRQPPLNGTGSVLSAASNASILKSSSSSAAAAAAAAQQQLPPQNQLTHPQLQQPTTPSAFQIPPGYALVPLNPNQAAIPPGFGIVPTTDVRHQQQQQQQPALRQRAHHVQGDLLPPPPLPHIPASSSPRSPEEEEEGRRQTNPVAHRTPSQTASDADTLRNVSLNEGEDGVESEEEEEEEEDALNSALDFVSYSSSSSNNGRMLIPLDGNLISFSAKKFSQFLVCLNVDDFAVESCRKHRIDGRRFSRMSDVDLERRGILHPVVLYFRKKTGKRTNNALIMH